MQILLRALAANVIMIYSPLRRHGRKRESMITIESLVNRHHCRQEKSHRLESVAFSSLAR